MSEDDPLRLKAQPDAAPELVRALSALGAQGADPERLSRVANRLGSLLDAPAPPLPTSLRVLRFARRQLTTGKLVVAGVVAGAAVFGGVQLRSATAPAREVVLPTPVEQVAAPHVEPVPEREPAEVSQPSAVAEPAPAPPAHSDEPRRPPIKRRARSVEPKSPAPAPLVSSPPTSAVDAPASDAPGAGPGARSTPSAAEPSAPPALRATEAPARKRAEADILSEARKQLGRDPAAALRLAEEHHKLYADGLLAPEREVLAIEALRALGQTAAAEQRLQRFRARYPDSLHLRRLERAR